MEASKEYMDRITAEEAEFVFDQFDESDAWELGNIMAAEARKRGIRLAVDVRRPGQILFHAVIGGATPDNDEWIRRKSNVAFRFRRSSLGMHINLALMGKTIEERYFLDPREYIPFGGAFPIVVRGVGMVACATVSSLPHEEDHAFVVDCLRMFKG